MNKITLLLIGVVIIGAAAFAGFSTPSKSKSNTPAVAINTSCIDEGAPITTDTVSYKGVTYNLIKSDALVGEPGKFTEMIDTGEKDADGHPIYTMGKNYFGDSTPDLIFVLQNTEVPPPPVSIYKIYLREGVQIPEYIKNCKSTGGKIVVGGIGNFPPDAFNKTEIVGLSDSTVASTYVYINDAKTTLSFVTGLGAKRVGILPVPAKNKNLPLYFYRETMFLIDGSDAYQYLPTDKPIDLPKAKKTLQLKKAIFVQAPTYSWYTPALKPGWTQLFKPRHIMHSVFAICKPAIYLYPTKKENVNVKVNTTGFFTLTIPDYNSLTGWDVVANPDGIIETAGNQYPYLYYESKVPDSKITKPKNGYVITQNELSQLFQALLPKLGLNNKEMEEFIDYWTKALPFYPYYFVGVMDKKSIDRIEPLDINPNPDSIIRVRLYFEMLSKPIDVSTPKITIPERNGFTVVEWGGMVKTDKDHPFTCSQ